MANASEKFVKFSQSSTRQVETRILIYDYVKSSKTWKYSNSYTGDNGIISWNITGGQQTGKFRIGKTICKSLEITLLKNTVVGSDSKLVIQVRFINPDDLEDVSEWRTLGTFYVDTISISENRQTKKIVAADRMLKLEKSYRSKKGFPMLMSDILNEVAETDGVEIDKNVNYINNPAVPTFPYKGQSQVGLRILYTRRQIVGFVASLLGANAYFNINDELSFTNYSKNSVKIELQNCFKVSSSGYDYDIEDVIWADKGKNSAVDDEDSYKKIYFENPFDISVQEKNNATAKIKALLVGKSLRQISIEKQGTGLYEIGETVTVQDSAGIFDIIVCGIKYSMSNSGFKETIFSVASSESESNYDDTSTGSYGSGPSNAILYQVSDKPVTIGSEYKDVFEMKFGSETGASVVAAVTLSAEVKSSGNITTGFFVDTKLYEEFTNFTESGSKIISITYPLVNIPNGGHTLIVKVKGEAEASLPLMHSYLTLIATGVSGEGGFDGTLEISDTLDDIVLKDDELTIGELNSELNTTLLTPIGSDISQPINDILMKNDDMFTISPIVYKWDAGDNKATFIDSKYRTFKTKDGKQLIVKIFKI